MRLGLPAPGLKSKAQVQVLTLSSPTAAPENVTLTLLGGGPHHRGSIPQAPTPAPRTYPQVSDLPDVAPVSLAVM